MRNLIFFGTNFTPKSEKMKNKYLICKWKSLDFSVHSSFLFICLLLSACNTNNNETTDHINQSTTVDHVEGNETSASNKLLYQGNAEFLKQLFALSKCDSVAFVPITPTGPISCSASKIELHNFCETYKSENTLNYHPTKIKVNPSMRTFFNKINTDGYGLVFHYGYDVIKNEIVYILSKGKLTNSNEVSYCPFSAGDTPGSTADHYLILETNGSNFYKTIDGKNLNALKSNYLNNMKISNGITYAKIDPNNHPKLVYHTASELVKFFDKYVPKPGDYLYIAHGSIKSDITDRAYHTPCLFFGNDTAFFELNNTPNTDTTSAAWYTNKGLNIGKLCPPHCKTPVTPC